MEKTLNKIVKQIKKKITTKPKVAIALGSGLGAVAEQVENPTIINYHDLKGMPVSTIKGHSGRFIIGSLNGVEVIIMQGRLHLNEGYDVKQVVLPIYIFKELGVETYFVTNSAGTVNPEYNKGEFMIIKDHINFTGKNPLIGKRIKDFGTYFIDMTDVYDKELIKKLNKIATKNKLTSHEGVYMQLLGPNYETAAEVKMARGMGADCVGMSTVCEVIAARHCNLKVAGVSLVTNKATGLADYKLAHADVLKEAAAAKKDFCKLVTDFIKTLK